MRPIDIEILFTEKAKNTRDKKRASGLCPNPNAIALKSEMGEKWRGTLRQRRAPKEGEKASKAEVSFFWEVMSWNTAIAEFIYWHNLSVSAIPELTRHIIWLMEN